MGLKEVLSKMKIVEMDADEVAAAAPARRRPPAAPGARGHQRPARRSPRAPRDRRAQARRRGAAGATGHGDEAGDEIPDFPADLQGRRGDRSGRTATAPTRCWRSSPRPASPRSTPRAKAAALTGFLNMNPSGPVPITDIVQDAVRRDQALDKFEEFLRAKLATRAQQTDKDNAKLQAEIDEVTRRNREKMEANRARPRGRAGPPLPLADPQAHRGAQALRRRQPVRREEPDLDRGHHPSPAASAADPENPKLKPTGRACLRGAGLPLRRTPCFSASPESSNRGSATSSPSPRTRRSCSRSRSRRCATPSPSSTRS